MTRRIGQLHAEGHGSGGGDLVEQWPGRIAGRPVREIRGSWRATQLSARGPIAGFFGRQVHATLGQSSARTVGAHRPRISIVVVEDVHHAAGVIAQLDLFAAVVECPDKRAQRRREPGGFRQGLRIDGNHQVTTAGDHGSLRKFIRHPAAQPPTRDVHVDRHLVVQLDPLQSLVGRSHRVVHDLVEGHDRITRRVGLSHGLVLDNQADGYQVGLHQRVGRAIGEQIAANKTGLRLVDKRAIRLQLQRAALRRGHQHGGQRRAVDVRIVTQHAVRGRDLQGLIEQRDVDVGGRLGPIIDGVHAEANRRRRRLQQAVAEHVGELVVAEIIGRRCVAERPVRLHLQLAMLRLTGQRQRQRIAFRVDDRWPAGLAPRRPPTLHLRSTHNCRRWRRGRC